jgi:hypothetical protein
MTSLPIPAARSGGVIVTEFFDVDQSRSIPWQRRPEANALLAELRNPKRELASTCCSPLLKHLV